jgi:hypothetical protein
MFQNLIMLAGLGGAVMPLIIHLLSRARYRTVDFGAMMFLESPTPVSRQYPGRLREITLLGVRMLLVGLLAIALARPVAQSLATPTAVNSVSAGAGADAASAERRVAAVIVVDCSASMAHEEAGEPRITMARAAVLQIISTLKRGDQVAVMPTSARGSTSAVELTGDLQSAASHAADLQPTATSADLPRALTSAAEVLSRQQGDACRLYLVCDRQASNWRDVDDDYAAALRRSLASSRASFFVIPIGSNDAANVAVESAEDINPPLVARCAGQAEVRVHNYGSHDELGLPVTIRSAGRELFSTTVNVPAGQSVRINCPLTIVAPGPQVASVDLRGGSGDLDDRREFVIEVSPPLRTLIVRQHETPAAERSDFLAAALAPFGSAPTPSNGASVGAGGNVATCEFVAADGWDEQSLPQYQVLALDDVAALTTWQARAVEQFVYAGGGVLIAPARQARSDQYNRLLFREENGLLPALLQSPVTHATPQRIEPATIDLSHPMMRFLAPAGSGSGSGSGVIANVPGTVTTAFATTGRTPTARALASMSSGDPLLLESGFGRGRVVLLTCGLDARWSSLPLTNVYLPLVQNAVRYLAGGAAPAVNVTAGQSLVARFDLPAEDLVRLAVQRPDGSSAWADVTLLEDRAEARYADTAVPGVYTIKLPPPPSNAAAPFAVAPSSEESDLTPLDESRWTDLSKELGFTRVTDVRALAVRLAASRTNSELWLSLLAGVLGLIVVELGLTRAWQGEAS